MRSFFIFAVPAALASEAEVCATDGTCAQDEATLLQLHGLRGKTAVTRKQSPCTAFAGSWGQWEIDNSKCNGNENFVCVNSQEECQEVAIANEHRWYSFRHNEARGNECRGDFSNGRHKCFSSAHCNDAQIGDTNHEWKIYHKTVPFRCLPGPSAQRHHNDLMAGSSEYTFARCEQECADNPECLSFDFSTEVSSGDCKMSSTSIATGGSLRTDLPYEYCEKELPPTSPTFSCLPGPSAQRHHNDLMAETSEYTFARCRQECADNSECLSFDISTDGTGDCKMSSTTIATGGDLRNDLPYQYCEKVLPR